LNKNETSFVEMSNNFDNLTEKIVKLIEEKSMDQFIGKLEEKIMKSVTDSVVNILENRFKEPSQCLNYQEQFREIKAKFSTIEQTLASNHDCMIKEISSLKKEITDSNSITSEGSVLNNKEDNDIIILQNALSPANYRANWLFDDPSTSKSLQQELNEVPAKQGVIPSTSTQNVEPQRQ